MLELCQSTLSKMSAKSRSVVQSMLHSPIMLPHLRTLELSWPGQGPNQTALRRFIRHQLPSIKYHNQQLKVIIHPTPTEGAQTIKFTRGMHQDKYRIHALTI